jgi:hypothetical protein
MEINQAGRESTVDEFIAFFAVFILSISQSGTPLPKYYVYTWICCAVGKIDLVISCRIWYSFHSEQRKILIRPYLQSGPRHILERSFLSQMVHFFSILIGFHL